jgi:excisionase family DNA binding protein
MGTSEPGRTNAKTISVEEAGRWLGVSRNTAYEAAGRGEIPTIRIGRLLRVPVAPFERLLGMSVTTMTEAA